MSNEHNTDRHRQPDRQAQPDNPDNDRQPDRKAQPDKPSRDRDFKSDRQHQEKEGKGKTATSPPGGSESDKERF